MFKRLKKIALLPILVFILMFSIDSKSQAAIVVSKSSEKDSYSIAYTTPDDVDNFIRLLSRAYTVYTRCLDDSMQLESDFDDDDDLCICVPHENLWLDLSFLMRDLGGRAYDLNMGRFLASFILSSCDQTELHKVDIISLKKVVEFIIKNVYKYADFSISACKSDGKNWHDWSFTMGKPYARSLSVNEIVCDCIK